MKNKKQYVPYWPDSYKIEAINKAWRESQRKKLEERNHKRRMNRKRLLLGSEGSHTVEQWENLKSTYNFTCPCCGKSEPRIKLTKDHIVALINGGSDFIENIQPLCLSCNCSKNKKTIKFDMVLCGRI